MFHPARGLSPFGQKIKFLLKRANRQVIIHKERQGPWPRFSSGPVPCIGKMLGTMTEQTRSEGVALWQMFLAT